MSSNIKLKNLENTEFSIQHNDGEGAVTITSTQLATIDDKGTILSGTAFQHRRGAVAENNAFTGAAGEVVVDTTNNRLRVHDGVTSGGFPIGDFVNVLDFGATGDGVTDDTAAIQDAIDYINIKGGGTLFIPNGDYKITNIGSGVSITLCDNLTILGENKASLRGSGGAIILDGAGIAYLTIKDIDIYGSNDGSTQDLAEVGIKLDTNSSNVTFENIRVFNSTGNSFYFADSNRISVNNCKSYGSGFLGLISIDCDSVKVHDFVCEDSMDAYSVQMKGTTNSIFDKVVVKNPNSCGIIVNTNTTSGEHCRNITVTDCTVYGSDSIDPTSGTKGLILVQGVDITVQNCLIRDNNKTISGIRIYGVPDITEEDRFVIDGNIIRNVGGSGIYSTAGSDSVIISDNTISECEVYGLQINTTDGTYTISGNQFKNNNQSDVYKNIYLESLGEAVNIVGNIIVENGSGTNRVNLFVEATTAKGVIANNTFIRNNAADIKSTTSEWRTDCPNIDVINNNCAFLITTGWQSNFDVINGKVPITSPYVRNSAPPSGTWKVGDIIKDDSPSAGGYIGWVCVTAGSPGTWKAFGTISV